MVSGSRDDFYGSSEIDASRYITEDGTGIRVGALITTVVTALGLAIGGFWIGVIEAFVEFHVAIINGMGVWVSNLVTTVLGESAGLIADSWRIAFVEAIQFGPLAPLLLALEAVIILTIAWAIWNRRPYA